MSTEHYAVGPNGAVVAETALTAGDCLLTAPTTNTATVWVDSGPVTGPLGVELTPGSSQPWPAGKPLHAWSASSADLYVTDGLDTGTNPGAVASAILAQGLAAQIAAQIAVSGAPPVDVNAVIFTTSYLTVAGTDALSTVIDTSKYQSITVRISEVDTATGAPVARNIELQWMDASGSSVRDTDGFGLTGTNDAATGDASIFTTYQTPVRGPDLTLKVRGNSKAGTTINVQVIGSYKTLSSPRYVLRSGWWASAGSNLFAGKGFDNFAGFVLNNYPGNTATDFYPPVKGGTAVFGWDAAGPIGASVSLAVVDLDSNVILYNSGAVVIPGSGSLTTVSTQLVVPNRPLALYVQTGGSATAWTFVRGSLSYLDHS